MDFHVPGSFASLAGRPVTSIVFVMDNLQIVLDGPILTLWVWPHIVVDGLELRDGSDNYAETLRSLIGEEVRLAAERSGLGLALVVGNSELRVNPSEDEIGGPEIAMLRSPDGIYFDVWREGEGLFEL